MPCSSIGSTALSRSYMLARDPAKVASLQATHPHFAWTSPAGCPDDLPLFLLQEGDARPLAAELSCGQDIAGDGAFSLGMIAEFESSLRRYGPWFYRRLFWETGLIGQVLYLEAEARVSAPRASAAFSTTRSTRCWDSMTQRFSRSITSRLAGLSRTLA